MSDELLDEIMKNEEADVEGHIHLDDVGDDVGDDAGRNEEPDVEGHTLLVTDEVADDVGDDVF